MKVLSPSALILFAGLLFGMTASVSEAGEPIYLGQRSAGRTALAQVNHCSWNSLLQKYVDQDGYVDYRAWRASAQDASALSQYVQHLSQADLQATSSHDEKLAFWINAYNAVTLHGILTVYPTNSIRNHTSETGGYNIWKDLQLLVGGRPHSLEAIEHQILRKMGEPRIHFAIVCASIGCPRLLNQAYTAKNVQQQLELNTRDFFSRPQNFQFDPQTQQFRMSEIMSWFGTDFGPDQSAQLRTIARWLPTRAAQAAAQRGTGRVSFLKYDWNLNDRSSRQRGAVRPATGREQSKRTQLISRSTTVTT